MQHYTFVDGGVTRSSYMQRDRYGAWVLFDDAAAELESARKAKIEVRSKSGNTILAFCVDSAQDYVGDVLNTCEAMGEELEKVKSENDRLVRELEAARAEGLDLDKTEQQLREAKGDDWITKAMAIASLHFSGPAAAPRMTPLTDSEIQMLAYDDEKAEQPAEMYDEISSAISDAGGCGECRAPAASQDTAGAGSGGELERLREENARLREAAEILYSTLSAMLPDKRKESR